VRHDDLTLTAFGRMFRRLLLAHQRQIPAGDLEETIGLYYDLVRRFAEPIVGAAVERLVREPSRFFPKAGELYALAAQLEGEQQRRYGGQPQPETGNDCPACRRAFYVAGYLTGWGAVVGRLRCGCEAPGQGWADPAALAWRETARPAFDGVRGLLDDSAPKPRTRQLAPIAASLPSDVGDAWEAA